MCVLRGRGWGRVVMSLIFSVLVGGNREGNVRGWGKGGEEEDGPCACYWKMRKMLGRSESSKGGVSGNQRLGGAASQNIAHPCKA